MCERALGQTHDPTIENLVFTYIGPDFQASGGPFAPFSFNGLSALSTFGGITMDAFTTFTTKNKPSAEAGNPNQIHTVLGTYKDRVFTELFPGRTGNWLPKTLIFAKDDAHAEGYAALTA